MVVGQLEEQVDLFKYLQGQGQEKKSSAEELEKLRKSCLECRRCSLREGAQNVVFGEGSPHARIIFIGEGPGGEEDRLGRPFVGAAGLLLDRILAASNLKREDIYIANVVKCRPQGNRTPQKNEIDTCLSLLKRQIEIIDAPILVCLGAVASKALIDPAFSITAQRGRWLQIGGRHVLPTFHPAALLRDPRKKRPVWEDMQEVMKKYRELFPEGEGDNE
jgi:uracil-DNA glycosylase family 4